MSGSTNGIDEISEDKTLTDGKPVRCNAWCIGRYLEFVPSLAREVDKRDDGLLQYAADDRLCDRLQDTRRRMMDGAMRGPAKNTISCMRCTVVNRKVRAKS